MSPTSYQSPILPPKELAELAEQWKLRGETVVFTNGCFDLLHVGHLKTLEFAKNSGSKLIVGLNSDESVRRLKGPSRPVTPEMERAALMASMRCVDAVGLFTEDTPVALLERIRPHVHVKGGDYRKEDLPEAEVVEKYGGRILLVDLVKGRSTTGLLQVRPES